MGKNTKMTNDCDSGPFCRHWGDPSDCNEKCKCGHKCCQHDYIDNDCCICDCEQFDGEE